MGQSYRYEHMGILCMFKRQKQPAFTRNLELFASSVGCNIIWGHSRTPDMIALPCLAIIVDRPFAGRREWRSYIEYRRCSGEDILCIVIDDKKNFKASADDWVRRINVSEPYAVPLIKKEFEELLANRSSIPKSDVIS